MASVMMVRLSMVGVLLGGALAQAASFDCKQAATPVEKAICADKELGELDMDLADLYREVQPRLAEPDRVQLVQAQRLWLKQLEPSRLNAQYQTRLAELGALWQAAPAADSPRASANRAFDALLSMPQAAPTEGTWDIAPPEGFTPGDEAILMQYLAGLPNLDLREIQHEGTLLQHALRAGLDKTARWLLQRGADPLQRNYEMDALNVAVQFERWAMLAEMLKHPSVAKLPRHTLATRYWPAEKQFKSLARRVWQHGVPFPTGPAGQCLLERLLREQLFDMALRHPERVARTDPPDAANWQNLSALCRRPYYSGQPSKLIGGIQKVSRAQLEALDSRLETPLLPYLLPLVTNIDDARYLLQLKLRRPWQDAAFTQLWVQETLHKGYPVEVATLLVQAVPQSALTGYLQEKQLYTWFNWAAFTPLPTFHWALAVVDPAQIQRAPQGMLQGLKSSKQEYWKKPLDLLPNPLPANLKLDMYGLPITVAHRLLQLGYRPDENNLSYWLSNLTASDLQNTWRWLKELPYAKAMIDVVLHDSWQGCVDPNVAMVDKVKFLQAQGLKAQKAHVLCDTSRAPQEAAALLAAGVVAAAKTTNTPTKPGSALSVDTVRCQAQTNHELRRALAAYPSTITPNIKPFVTLLDQPGDSSCALVIWAINDFRQTSDTGSFTTGPAPEPVASCVESVVYGTLWRVVGNKLIVGKDALPTVRGALRDKQGIRYFLAFEERCRAPELPRLLTWEKSGKLTAVTEDSPVYHQFTQFCIASPCVAPEIPNFSYTDFVAKHFDEDKQRFLQAWNAFDLAKLTTERQAGIFPSWRMAALEAVNQASLDAAQQRQRIDWLFRTEDISAVLALDNEDGDTARMLAANLPPERLIRLARVANTEQKRILAKLGNPLACYVARQLNEFCRE